MSNNALNKPGLHNYPSADVQQPQEPSTTFLFPVSNCNEYQLQKHNVNQISISVSNISVSQSQNQKELPPLRKPARTDPNVPRKMLSKMKGTQLRMLRIKHDLSLDTTREERVAKIWHSMMESRGLTLRALEQALSEQSKILSISFHGSPNGGTFSVDFDQSSAMSQLLESKVSIVKDKNRIYFRDCFAAIARFIEEEVLHLVQSNGTPLYQIIPTKNTIFEYAMIGKLVKSIAERLGCPCVLQPDRIEIHYGVLGGDADGNIVCTQEVCKLFMLIVSEKDCLFDSMNMLNLVFLVFPLSLSFSPSVQQPNYYLLPEYHLSHINHDTAADTIFNAVLSAYEGELEKLRNDQGVMAEGKYSWPILSQILQNPKMLPLEMWHIVNQQHDTFDTNEEKEDMKEAMDSRTIFDTLDNTYVLCVAPKNLDEHGDHSTHIRRIISELEGAIMKDMPIIGMFVDNPEEPLTMSIDNIPALRPLLSSKDTFRKGAREILCRDLHAVIARLWEEEVLSLMCPFDGQPLSMWRIIDADSHIFDDRQLRDMLCVIAQKRFRFLCQFTMLEGNRKIELHNGTAGCDAAGNIVSLKRVCSPAPSHFHLCMLQKRVLKVLCLCALCFCELAPLRYDDHQS